MSFLQEEGVEQSRAGFGQNEPVILCLLPSLVLGLAWYAVIRILWSDWSLDPQYSYGILVPLLVVGLLVRRWEDRPMASILSPFWKLAVTLVLFGATLLIAVTIPMSEANPDWRPLGCIVAMGGVTLTLCFITLVGGMRWLSHFAFPVCFFLIAVPWPRNFQQSVMFHLMEWNTAATLEFLHWLGVEASGSGNMIVMPSGVLGIEEACSGIRSLQSGLMVALFFGEIFRLCLRRRILLLLLAVLAALAGNMFRNSLLALIASSRGMDSVTQWHDPAGVLVLLIVCAVIVIIALYWKYRSKTTLPERTAGAHSFVARLSPFVLMPVLALLAASLVGTELWFFLHEQGGVHPWSWSLQSHKNERGVVTVPISPTTLRLLFYPEGFSEKWVRDHHEEGQVFYFEWPSGRAAAQAMSMHNPEVCLANIGLVLVSRLSPVDIALGGQSVSFDAWLFQDHGRSVYVFRALMAQGANAAAGVVKDSPAGRVHALIEGRRNLGERMLEVAFWNLPDEQTARQALGDYLEYSVKPATPAQ